MSLTTTLRYNPNQICVTELNQRVQREYTRLRQRFPTLPQDTALALACDHVRGELTPLPIIQRRRSQPIHSELNGWNGGGERSRTNTLGA